MRQCLLSVALAAISVLSDSSQAVARRDAGDDDVEARVVKTLRLTTLSTMLTDTVGVGEWGYAALIEVDGHRILFDTGARPQTVLQNAAELGIDLTNVTEVILSHNHSDHTGGLLNLRRELSKTNPRALNRVHVATGMFSDRPLGPSPTGQRNYNTDMMALREAYEVTGGIFLEHSGMAELYPGVWLTGPVPRVHPERNWNPEGRIRTNEGVVVDTIPEDQALVIKTDEGLVIITGCGHAGIVNIMTYARAKVPDMEVYAVVGGLHLLGADDTHLEWTADRMREFGLRYLLGAHCTGINAVFTLRTHLAFDRRRAVVGAVGSTFELGSGIDPRILAR